VRAGERYLGIADRLPRVDETRLVRERDELGAIACVELVEHLDGGQGDCELDAELEPPIGGGIEDHARIDFDVTRFETVAPAGGLE
jgi:hypothetical protein